MIVSYKAPEKPEGKFTVEFSESELARLVGIVGQTFGSDGDGLYQPLAEALQKAKINMIRPQSTHCVYRKEK